MYFPDILVLSFLLGHSCLELFILIYIKVILEKLKIKQQTLRQCCPGLIIIDKIQVLIHGFTLCIMLVHGEWNILGQMVLVDIVGLPSRIYRTIGIRSGEIFHPSELHRPDRLDQCTKDYKRYIKNTVAMIGSTSIKFIKKLQTSQIAWSKLFFSEVSLFFVVTGLTEVILAILTFTLIKLSYIESNPSAARMYCRTFNKLLPLRAILHGALSGILLAYGRWTLFLLNLPILGWELYKVAAVEGIQRAIYDPIVIVGRNSDIDKHKRHTWMCLLYSFGCLYAYPYCLVAKWGDFLVVSELMAYQTVAGKLAIIITVQLVSIFSLFSYLEHGVIKMGECTSWLNALYTTVTVLHLHLTVFLLIHSDFNFFLVNFSALMIEVYGAIYDRYRSMYLSSQEQIIRNIKDCSSYIAYFLVILGYCLYCLYSAKSA